MNNPPPIAMNEEWAEELAKKMMEQRVYGIPSIDTRVLSDFIRQHCVPKEALAECVKALKLAGDPYCECEFQHASYCPTMTFRNASRAALTNAKQYLKP
jgi:carbamoylphosphate synthase small subunit